MSSTISELPESSRTVMRYPRRLLLLFLDFVSDDRAADRTGDGRRRFPAAAPDLVADHATSEAADQGSAVDRLVVGRDIDVDGFDFALVGAGGGFGHRHADGGCYEQA